MRVFLIGLSESLARSLARFVSGDRRVELTGVVPSLALASALLPTARPDLALLDWSALDGSPRDAVHMLRADRPGMRIACVASEGEPYRDAAVHAGADTVISKDRFAEELECLLRGFFPEPFAEIGGQNEATRVGGTASTAGKLGN